MLSLHFMLLTHNNWWWWLWLYYDYYVNIVISYWKIFSCKANTFPEFPASMSSGFLHMLASLATHWRTRRPSRAPPFLRYRSLSIYQWQRVWYGGRVRRSSMTATCTTRTRPHIALWLERPVHRHTGDLAGPEASVSSLLSWEQVTVHFWPATFTVLDDNSLQCAHTAVATTRRRSIFYFAARHTRGRDQQPTTSIQPTLDACGPFWSRSGRWHAPPTGNERERERDHEFPTLSLPIHPRERPDRFP